MRPRRLVLSALSRRDRRAVVSDVNDAIQDRGGWVDNHTAFSNIAIALMFTLPEGAIRPFVEDLIHLGVSLDQDSLEAALGSEPTEGRGERDQGCALNITFIHDEPDLRRDIPAVPG
jgi:hypothetical protein